MRASGISKSAQFVQQKAVKFCAAENCVCAEMFVLLVRERVVHIGFLGDMMGSSTKFMHYGSYL